MAFSYQDIHSQLRFNPSVSNFENLDFTCVLEEPDNHFYEAYWERYFQDSSAKTIPFLLPKRLKNSEDSSLIATEVSCYFKR